MDDRTDQQLLRAFAGGDDAAFGLLASRYEPGMLGLARGLLDGSEGLAREAVQESWVRVIRGAEKFRGDASVGTWFYRIVVNQCADTRAREARAARRSRLGMAIAGRAEAVGSRNESGSALQRAMSALPESQRVVLMLCFGRGMSHTQAAGVLEIPVGTVKSRAHGGMVRLRALMGENQSDKTGGAA